MSTHLLIIGYGNEIRSDDAVGPRVAREIASWGDPRLQAIAVHQLTPELVEMVAAAERVVFVDAGLDDEGAVWTRLLEPAAGATGVTHSGDPRELLALADALYGRHPEAWLITVPAASLEFGEGLSVPAERGVEAALRQIRLMAGDFYSVTEESQRCSH
jgi:hydrogenase maturation protease